jgi:DNA-binding NarL/FixJ family response regulator
MASSPSPASVVVVDDDAAIRHLVQSLLERSSELEWVGEASDGAEAVQIVEELQPDIVLLDLKMGGVDGRRALPQVLTISPRSMVLVLSGLPAETEATGAFAAGAFAYLEKSTLGLKFADHVLELFRLFVRALDGEDVWAPGATQRARN